MWYFSIICGVFQGMYYQIGDVVSLVDHDSSVYYAQLRGFMQDQYNEKSAVITWLLPTQGSPRHRFDPATYILGRCMLTGYECILGRCVLSMAILDGHGYTFGLY